MVHADGGFFLGLGLGFSGPLLVSRYLDPYFPAFLKETLHPLEGSVTHKQRQQDQLLITITTQDGTILATFQQQVQEIDLLIEERDLVTLDVRQYEPFVNDPRLLRVTKYMDVPPANDANPNSSIQSDPTQEMGSKPDPTASVP
ncbi:MAG: hypothetical protein H0W49_03225 [Nitrospirales bacterium]|nr:hypothetical protein [Nitrospirales bacterium]MBA3964692.1 hypothetical protein [Nitrospirales bacterium]